MITGRETGQRMSRGWGGRGATPVPDLVPDLAVPFVSMDQWMIDVLADLQEAARDRDMMSLAGQLGIASRVAQDEIARKRRAAMADRQPPPGYRRN